MPEVSVIIPNYNHASFLQQRIESVLGQTYDDIEVIILDDCSIDHSRNIIEQYRNHPRVNGIVYNQANSGSTFTQWNKGVDLCRADNIWIAESDDFADKNFLAVLMPVMLAHENIGIAYCQSNKVNDKNEVTGTWKEDTDSLNNTRFATDFKISGKEYIKQYLIHWNTIPNASGVIFRKSFYKLAGGAEPGIKNCSDWLTWLKMLLISDISYVAKPLNYFRYHDKSVIAIAEKEMDFSRYVERYDRTMRKRFQQYLITNHCRKTDILKLNFDYILKEHGDEGLFEINNKRLFKGWNHLVKTLRSAGLNLFYIKAGLKQSLKRIIRM